MSEHVEGIRRRTRSVTRAEEITAEENKVRRKQPDKPYYNMYWPHQTFMSSFTLLQFLYYEIEAKYHDDNMDCVLKINIFADSCVPVVLCLLTEKGLAAEIIQSSLGMTVHITNLLVLILLPMIIIHIKDGFSLVGASCVTTLYSILFLKLWSYVQVNMWCRTARQTHKLRRQSLSSTDLKKCKSNKLEQNKEKKELKKLVQYPDNLNLKDLYYFLCVPTLCYELNFPRTDRIRKRFLMKRIFEVLIGVQITFCIIQQYMIPSVKNSLIPFSNMDYTRATERLLKLAIPNHLAWLCMFYVVFHSWLNLLGEILHFADRSFYDDWWNANNMDTFWRKWNLPVHRWAVRHLYFPMIDMGYSKFIGGVAVFFISAFFHEYMVSVPLKTYKIWAFMGMMGQIPLSFVSKYVERTYGLRFGNLVFWSSIILGQPLCIMMYYHDYIMVRYGESLLEDYSHV
nr:diacylglycerol O-acyltransferase 1 [Leptinotarsa decemlineata]